MENSSAPKIWFYESSEGKRIGPIYDPEMRVLVKNGSIPRGTLIWSPNFSDWQPIESTELLSTLTEAIAPPELPQPNNFFVWLLALMPILGYFIEMIIWVICTPWTVRLLNGYHAEYFLISIFLNCIFLALDAWLIKRAGRDISKLWGGLILVPIYLFQRRKLLNHNYSYFTVWIACFVIELFFLFV